MHIKIIRHAERFDLTFPHLWIFYFGYYWCDPPLTNNGHLSARLIGRNFKNFHPKYIYSSPYIRTIDTAKEIRRSFPHSKIIIEPLLSEYQPFFKHTTKLFPNGIPTTFRGMKTNFSFPEKYTSFIQRIKFIIQQIINQHSNHDDILIVTHAGFMQAYLRYLNLLCDKVCPNLKLSQLSLPYLTTLSFQFDKNINTIIESTISLS